MIKYLATKFLEKQAEKRWEENKKIIMYTGITILTGLGAYFSYKKIKNYILDREMSDELNYLDYLEDEESYDKECDEIYNKKDEDEELKEKIDEFNSRRLSYENDEIVSPKELNHYIDQIKVDKCDIEEEEFEEDKYEKYDE
ncbi:hypothetical protein [Romboutsia sp. Marseille-P6047]|uniref:hypothetical protein n=1 Tax=Romboutsia sp. Marseille-P6047 TaxID=2161817 RepID=UPI000F062A7C|nr:hypothetical protein [Romboutsia sp. Marseille-P6047]